VVEFLDRLSASLAGWIRNSGARKSAACIKDVEGRNKRAKLVFVVKPPLNPQGMVISY
jgi:hypothetical protein